MIIIGISGKKRSGKDTLYSFISAFLKNYKIGKIAFADALKEEVALATGVKTSFIEEEKETFRTILQWWGTDFRRKFNGDDYWIKKLLDKISRSDLDVVIITDVRFKNEADILKECGAFLVRINRTFTHNQTTIDLHPSEIDLDNYKFNLVIDNSGTLLDLKSSALEIAKIVLNKKH